MKSFIFYFEDHLISAGKTVEISVKTFFFLEVIFGPNCSIFSVYFGLHKTGIPSYFSWPRAHVWLSAPLFDTESKNVLVKEWFHDQKRRNASFKLNMTKQLMLKFWKVPSANIKIGKLSLTLPLSNFQGLFVHKFDSNSS